MKKIIFLYVLFLSCTQADAQITKGNWLVGGTGLIASDKTKFQNGEISSSQIALSPRIGLFIAERIPIGLIGNYSWNSSKTNNSNKISYTNFGIGPFVRYYFLKADNQINLLFEANGAYNVQKNSTISDNSAFFSYGLLVGPAIYFNSSVGLELLLGYKGYKETETETISRGVNLNIGFQIHLDK